MSLTTIQRADAVGTFRHTCARLMETLAGWVPSTPELEAKTLFGRHIWVCAQHADILGLRTVELRARLHYDRPAVPAYQRVLDDVRSAGGTADRVAGFYDALLPDLSARVRGYLDATDSLLDAPTADLMARILADHDRMLGDRRDLATTRPDLHGDSGTWVRSLRTSLAACPEFVDHRQGSVA